MKHKHWWFIFLNLGFSSFSLAQQNLDSLDAVQNKISAEKLLITGYRHFDRGQQKFWNLGPLLQNFVQYNSVEGFVFSENFDFNKGLNKQRFLNTGLAARYGLASGRFLAKGHVNLLLNRAKDLSIRLDAGQYVFQYNAQEPIGVINNTFTTLFSGKNLMKLYEKSFVQLGIKTEIFKGITPNISLAFEERFPLINQSDFSFKHKEKRIFTANDPQNPNNFEPAFVAHQALIFDFGLKISPEKWLSNPDKSYPVFSIQYKMARRDLDFDKMVFKISQQQSTPLGTTKMATSFATFLNTNNIQFIDYQHFMSNLSAFGSNNMEAFMMIGSYQFSTKSHAFQLQTEQHFEGYFLRNSPFFKKLNWHEVVSAKILYTPEQGIYSEFGLGLENIFQFYKCDFITSIHQGKICPAFRFGLTL